MKHILHVALAYLALILTSSAHASTVTYVYSDPQGTPLAEADASGNITAAFDYRPYGAQALGARDEGPGYTGHVNDVDSGLVYMQARYYDPVAGRFLSVDPEGPRASDLVLFARYTYVGNNPINGTDPDGKCPDSNPCHEATPYNFYRDTAAGSVIGHLVGDPIAIFAKDNINPLTQVALTPGEVQDAKLGAVTNVLSALVAPEMALAGSVERSGVAQEAKLTVEQAKNLSRFESKIPANAKESVTLRQLPNDGVAAQATSPGRVPGSSAVYEKQIDSTGKTVQYTKTTYDPRGEIVHVKDKITGQTIQ